MAESTAIATGDHLVVRPYGHPDKFGSLYFPEAYKDGEAQFGKVLTVGPEVVKAGIIEGYDVLYRPFKAEPIDVGFLGRVIISLDHVGAYAIGTELYPLPEFVMIAPDFARRNRERLRPKLIYIPDVENDGSYDPCLFGRVVRLGTDCRYVTPGSMVIMPPHIGHEVDFIDTRYYFIRETDLLGELFE